MSDAGFSYTCLVRLISKIHNNIIMCNFINFPLLFGVTVWGSCNKNNIKLIYVKINKLGIILQKFQIDYFIILYGN